MLELGRHAYVGAGPTAELDGALDGEHLDALLVGYVSYDAVRHFEPKIALRARREHGFPDASLHRYETFYALDRVTGRAHVIGRDRDRAARALEGAPMSVGVVPRARFVPRVTRAEYEAMVRRAKDHIERGDGQQIVLSSRFDAASDADPVAVYERLRAINPSPYMFVLKDGARAMVGASPETLVRVRDREITVRPIAGTRPRGRDDAEDAALERELRASEKENAEHVMLVDLGRNDVARVARGVRVRAYKTIERFSHVMHMTSEVTGDLRPNMTARDALRAAFPAGTVSGSPKVKAMQIIDALEPARRGPYAGCVLAQAASGHLDACITIRTLFFEHGRVSTQAGAGIVFDSSPSAEHDEVHFKARAMIAAAGGA